MTPNIRESRMIRSLPEPSISPAPELHMVHQSHSCDQRIEQFTSMISPSSPGPASPSNQVEVKPTPCTHDQSKPIISTNGDHPPPPPPKSPDTRTIRFAKQQRIKPISNSFLASDKIHSLLWHSPQELEERTRHWKNDTPTDQILEREEGLFFLQMLHSCPIQMDDEEASDDEDDDVWSPQQEERVNSAIQAVLQEQGRQNKQQEWMRQHNQQQHPTKRISLMSPSHQIWSTIGISKEEKDRLKNQDQTPMFMIALQYSWHTGRVLEAANHRAIHLAMEIKRLWRDEDDDDADKKETLSFASSGEDQQQLLNNNTRDHEEKKEERNKDIFYDDDDDDDIEEVPLNDDSSRDPRPMHLARGMSDHSEFSDLRGLVKRGSSRSILGEPKESLLHPDTYHGDRVHLVLSTKVAAFPQLSAMLKKQRSRARLSARSLSLKEDIQVNSTMRSKRNVLKDIDGGREERKKFFQTSVRKLITLNRFFQQVEGVSKDRALDADKKKFLAAIAAKKSSVFQSMQIPDHLDDDEGDVTEATKPSAKEASTTPTQVQSILLTPATKALRPKHKVVWGEELHRVKFIPEFPLFSERTLYFYSSEDISRFRFEKFMEDNNDEFEEEVLDSDDEEGQLESLNEEEESSYEELSYHSFSEGSYYEEEVVPEPAARDFASLFETQSVGSDGRRLSL